MKTSSRRTSTAWKLTRSFVFLGVIPIAILAIVFLIRYSVSIEKRAVDNLRQTERILCLSIGETIDSVDRTTSIIYDYENEQGRSLMEVLHDASTPRWQKRIYVNDLLEDMLNRNSDISSIRFVTEQDSYILFRNTEKELLFYPNVCDEGMFPAQENYRSRVIESTISERNYCSNSDDYIFSIVRNYMDASTIEKAATVVLGTIYVDVNVDVIAKYIETLDLRSVGDIYVYNPVKDQYLFISDKSQYLSNSVHMSQHRELIEGSSGLQRIDDIQLVYDKIDGTDYYVVIEAERSMLRNGVNQSVSYMMLTVIAVLIVLLLVFFVFSGKISEPARMLKVAMQEVENGNLNVTTDIHSGDEMEYLGQGFNNMVRRLNHYIEQVYEAQICRNTAELNALKLQIQPHFLYNTLDVIRMTALDNDDPQTAELLESLSAQMRYVVNNEEDVVPLRKEIENINDYFAIIRVRYQGRMDLIVNVKDEDLSLPVPKLLLQPLVENAVKHGLREKEGQGHVILELKREETAFEITVMDDGVGVEEAQADHIQEFMDSAPVGTTDREGHVGIGMKNIHDRIRMDYGPEYGLQFTSYVGMGTIIKVRLPLP